jgi:hypothetical protein
VPPIFRPGSGPSKGLTSTAAFPDTPPSSITAGAFLDNCRFNAVSGGYADFVPSSPIAGYQLPPAAGAVQFTVYECFAITADASQWETTRAAYVGNAFMRLLVVANSSGTGVAPGQTGAGSKINFVTPPIVTVVAIKESMLSFEEANFFTPAQQLQARNNLGFSTEIGKVEWWPTTVVQPGRVKANGQVLFRSVMPILFAYLVRQGVATFTNGSANVGMPKHGLSFGDPIKLFTSNTLPTNFSVSTHGLPTVGNNYFVKTVVDQDTVTLSSTVGGGVITAGSAGSGSHVWVNAPHGDGDGVTTYTAPDLRGSFARAWNDDAAVDVNRTIGDLQLDAFQGHRHGVSASITPGGILGFSGAGTIPGNTGGSSTATIGVSVTILDPSNDGTNGVPRTSTETRPRNVSLMATIRYAA